MESTNLIVILVGTTIFIVALLLNIIWHNHVLSEQNKGKKSWTHTTIRMLLETILAVALVSIVFETSLVRKMLRDEMKNLLAYESNLSDRNFLLKRFQKDDIRKFRRAANLALVDRKIIENEDWLLEREIYPVLEGPMVKKARYIEDQRIEKDVNGIVYFVVFEDVEMNIIPSNKEKIIKLPIIKTLKQIDGISSNNIFDFKYLSINNIARDPLPQVTFIRDGKTIIYSVEVVISTDSDKEIFIKWKSKYKIPLNYYWIETIKYPTSQIIISYHYDENEIYPTIKIFGMGDEKNNDIKPIESATGNKRWEYNNWLFKNHGWVLTWDILNPQAIYQKN